MAKKRYSFIPLLLISLASHSESTELSPYIYNGTTATIDTFPSIASIYYDAVEFTGVYGLYCGATILDAQHVLTAAHCLYDGNGVLNEEYLTYTSVAIQMAHENQFLNGSVEVIRASEFYIHSDYVDSSSLINSSWPNDIAIIKLASAINVDSTNFVVRATSSESLNYRMGDETFVAVGHGYTEDGDGQELLQTTLTYQPAEACDLGNISDSQLCMAGEENTETEVRNTTCSGDSGGPLYWYNGTKYVQVGITSYGWTGCYNADSDDTSVFTEVADYESWITSVLAGNETPDFTNNDDERENHEPGEFPSAPPKREYLGSSDDSDDSGDSDDSDDSDDDSISNISGGSFSSSLLLLLLASLAIRRNGLNRICF